MSSLDYLDLCRLCLVKDRVSVPIFEGEGDVRQIFLKIAACLPVKVAREDKLPKKICNDCVYKVELFYQFWNTTVNAEKQLLQWLGEVSLEDKQGYVTNVLNPSIMKQEQSTENRLDGNVMQQVSEHQNNMGMGMIDNMGLGIPMMISSANQQQITSVPMDTSSNSVQAVQAVPGPSSQTTHNQISQNQTNTTQQEDEEESSEDEDNSDDECDGDEGLPVKEESEEDPSNRTIEPTTFVNVSLACDEAGPSGLQQQKISDLPEMPIPQPADGDPKSGSVPRDPLEQTYLVVQNVDKYFLLPVDHDVQPPQKSPETITSELNIKTEALDEILDETTTDHLIAEEVHINPNNQIPPLIPIEVPAQLTNFFKRHSNSEAMLRIPNTKETTFGCDFCPKTFQKKYYLRRHMKTHTSLNFECDKCHQLLKSKRTLRLHMILHEDGKLYQCSDCDFMSKRQNCLKRHQIRMHSQYFEYQCPHCPKMFKLSYDLKRHQLKHLISPCRCEVCDTVFPNEFALRLHRTVDRYRRSNRCLLYDRIKGGQDLAAQTITPNLKIVVKPKTKKRKKKGTVKRVFNCSQCKWRFSSCTLLHKHQQRHLLSYKCETCGVVFKYKASFMKHEASHKEEVFYY